MIADILLDNPFSLSPLHQGSGSSCLRGCSHCLDGGEPATSGRGFAQASRVESIGTQTGSRDETVPSK
jgi:hypothetical protein